MDDAPPEGILADLTLTRARNAPILLQAQLLLLSCPPDGTGDADPARYEEAILHLGQADEILERVICRGRASPETLFGEATARALETASRALHRTGGLLSPS